MDISNIDPVNQGIADDAIKESGVMQKEVSPVLQIQDMVSTANQALMETVSETAHTLEIITGGVMNSLLNIQTLPVQMFNEVRDVAGNIIPELQQLSTLVGNISNDTFESLKRFGSDIITETYNNVSQTFQQVGSSIVTVVTEVGNDMKTAVEEAEGETETTTNDTKPSLDKTVDQLHTMTDRPIENIKKNVDNQLSKAAEMARNVPQGSEETVKDAIEKIGKEVGKDISETTATIEDAHTNATQSVQDLMSPAKEHGNQIVSQVKNDSQALISNAETKIQNLTNEGKDKSEAIVTSKSREVNNLSSTTDSQVEKKMDNLVTQVYSSNLSDEVKAAMVSELKKTEAKIKTTVKSVADTYNNALHEVKDELKKSYDNLKQQAIGAVIDIATEPIKTLGDRVVQKVQEVVDPINKKINDIKDSAIKTTEALTQKSQAKLKQLKDDIQKKVRDGTNKAMDTLLGKNTDTGKREESKEQEQKKNNNTSNASNRGTSSSSVKDNFAFKGELEVGNRRYGVVECTYQFSQTTDDTGKPTSRPKGGKITFVTPSMSDDDLFFYNWMINKTAVKSGYFRFDVFSYQNKRSYKTVFFKNAYCIELKDYFNDKDSRLMYSTITISAEEIIIGTNGGVRFSNEWT